MIRIGIYGFGNLGKAAQWAISQTDDLVLSAVFTRRNPSEIVLADPSVPVLPSSSVREWKGKLDLLLVCGGSAKDLPEMTPALAKDFCVVDSFDTHANIPIHFAHVNESAIQGGTLALISCGWDPGLFSLMRVLGESILLEGRTHTFWGKGVSQGHSDAIRRIPGVLDAKQYTVPCEDVLCAVRKGESPSLPAEAMHKRECFVVLAPDADPQRVQEEIVTMPHYFAGYDTTVHFISQEEFDRDHREIPHGGTVIRTGCSGLDSGYCSTMEFHLALDSNPAFTSAVLVAYARAVYRMYQRGRRGCISILDIAPADLSPRSKEELLAQL